MYMLISSPKGGQLKEAFDILDEVFGTEEFTQGQATNSISVALGVDTNEAQLLLNALVRAENVGEV